MVGDTGGLAKVTSAFANEMHKRGHTVSVIYADERSGDFFFPIDEDIKCYDVRLQNGKRIKYPLSLRLKREFYRLFSKQKARTVNNDFNYKYICPYMGQIIKTINPDIIVSFTPGASKSLIIDLNINNHIPIITMSHGNPEDYFDFYPVLSLEAVKVLLPSFKKVLEGHLPNNKIVVIGNVVPQFTNQVDLTKPKDVHKILFIGRLAKGHKRPHLLIEAFSKVADQFPNWIVELWGLELMIKQANLTDRVQFKGITKDVESVLSTGDIYAMMSASEGFGLSMAEAMAKGLPVIACDTWLGVSDMVQDEYNGILVADNSDDIAQGLKKLMSDNELCTNLGKNASNSMKQYAPNIIWSRWENLLFETIRN